jgi:hypothetical protein
VPVGEGEARVYLRDFGQAVVFGATKTTGILDHEVLRVADGYTRERVGTQTLLVESGSLGSVSVDSAITIGGTPYRVRSLPMPTDDGAFETLDVVKA